jgi:diacylglycerol kinase family enzyme
MTDVAVVAHSRKKFGGGLPELRKVLAEEGVTDPIWNEVTKSRFAPEYARRAVAQGADVLFVWGGDGTVQRCIEAVAGTKVAVAILPAGTANLLAMNLRIPDDLAEAVHVGLRGDRRRFDTGSVNGERFTVMAGAGFDARMIEDADRGRKNRLGRAAYLSAGASNLSTRRAKATIKVDGRHFSAARCRVCWRRTSARYSAASRYFPPRNQMTGSLNSAWSPRRIRPSGPERSPGWPSAARRIRRSSRSLGERSSRSGSTGRSCMSLTAAHALPCGNCGSRSTPVPSRSVYQRN